MAVMAMLLLKDDCVGDGCDSAGKDGCDGGGKDGCDDDNSVRSSNRLSSYPILITWRFLLQETWLFAVCPLIVLQCPPSILSSQLPMWYHWRCLAAARLCWPPSESRRE